MNRLLENLLFMRAGRSLPLRKLEKFRSLFTGGSTSVSTLKGVQKPLKRRMA